MTSAPTSSTLLAARIDAACDRIAPTWPLDEFIAVNPYWGWRNAAAPDAAALLEALAGTTLTMPRSWFREEWAAGRIAVEQLAAVAAELDGGDELLADAVALLEGHSGAARRLRRAALVTDVRERGTPPRRGQTWADLATHQISQYCAAHFDRFQGSWHPDQAIDLFAGWLLQPSATHGIRWRHGAAWARAEISRLPADPNAAIALMLGELAIPEEGHEAYLTALLLALNGWSAWVAYLRWQARLGGGDDHQIVGLLAIRLAWEWLLRNDADASDPASPWDEWAASWAAVPDLAREIAAEQRLDWLLQSALERTYQRGLIDSLAAAPADAPPAPAVQAVFCIDVRSEVFRRALELVSPAVHTRGFAGFFGLPISYTPVGSLLTRPQLPGLLAPVLPVVEKTSAGDGGGVAALAELRAATLGDRLRWSRFRSAPSSVFSFVETMGLLYGAKLVKDSVAHTGAPAKWENDGIPKGAAAQLRPTIELFAADPAAAAALAETVLSAMGLTEGFAPIVLLCGHGSQSANNPHAAGLDCGACGGQTGEVNARVLADALNAPAVRQHLRGAGIDIPTSTWFIAALHNTTTDQVTLFDTGLVPDALARELATLRERLAAAGNVARAERAEGLGLAQLVDRPGDLEQAVLRRANDWSQVRPEWGLAGNAAFIVAPRSRTRHMHLSGRSFLHDYDWRLDPDLSVLTLIMTAPMVVTNWINLQYHASTVDNRRYGSGNKVLHNVVGGRIGVFEGNGGDLRVGLPVQSLHDGHTLRHPPLRLSVFIEAPRAGIDSVIAAHDVVDELVSNGWLHLLRIEPVTGEVERRTREGWESA